MAVYFRSYQTLDECPPGERFYVRCIEQARTKDGTPREGVSVGFYGYSEGQALAKAHEWANDEREKAEKAEANLQALHERQRARDAR